MPYDFNRPYIDQEDMGLYVAIRNSDAKRFGRIVRATPLSNKEYKFRHQRLAKQNNMKPPPGSFMKIHAGYLVVRRLNTPNQYETWMPTIVFEDLYRAESNPASEE
jgi:hypothetical protein